MACLFGLGLGMALGQSKRDLTRWFPFCLLAITLLICLAAPLHLTHLTFLNPLEHYLIGHWGSEGHVNDTVLQRVMYFVPGLGVLVGVFYLLVFTFISMGQRLGILFTKFSPLTAYTANVFASLIGVALFSLVSFLSWPPAFWIALGAAMVVYFYRRWDQIAALVLCVVLAFLLADPRVLWSPYYRITVDECRLPADGAHPEFKYGYNINVNYDTIEGAYDNAPEKIKGLSEKQKKGTADYYDTPYIALGDKPRQILVLAAGTGNDVAAALRHGAHDIDAVEIDPAIAKLGVDLHPENPYTDQRVNVVVDDARAFMRRTDKKYDLIVFAYLDSHSVFSAMSSLRLDNYVYTKQSFEDARKLLKKDGVISVTFYYLNWWQLAHVYHALAQGTNEEPIGIFSAMGNGPTLLVGPGLDRRAVAASGLPEFTVDKASKDWGFSMDEWNKVDATTDDWPFLFLRDRSWSYTYSIGLLFTVFLGLKLVKVCFGEFTSDSIGRTMFFLGAAFMLIETKSVTQMGLLLGTTWLVNSAVIAAVLLMILLANLIQIKLQFRNLDVLYGLLFGALAFNFLFPLSVLNELPAGIRSIVGAVVLSLPLFFAAMVFAISFSRVQSPNKALGMNLLGTLVGGVMEYTSMIFGVNAMNVLAVMLYCLAYYFWRQSTAPEKHEAHSTVPQSI